MILFYGRIYRTVKYGVFGYSLKSNHSCTFNSSLSIQLPGMLSGCSSTDVTSPCVFPFIYEGRTYKLCTDKNEAPGKLWCSTTDNYDRDARRVGCTCSTPDLSSIFYTTDGSEPTLKSTVYNASIGMQLHGFGERTVKVKNYKQGYFDSPIMEASYSILPQMVSTMAGSSVGVQGFQDGFGAFLKNLPL